MKFYKKVDVAERKIKEMKDKFESKIFDESYIQELVGNQKGELDVRSTYYKGNIAEGNWSLIKEDSDIEELDKEKIDKKSAEDRKVDSMDVLLGLDEYEKEDDEYTREKDAEYQYVFIPSYYAVKTLILYYLEDRKKAEKIYGLKNAVVRRDSKKSEKFYGGLPFVLKYIREIYMKRKSKDDFIKFDFADIMQKLLDLDSNNIKDDFINDIIDCIKKSHCGYFILDKRIKDFKYEKEEYFCIDYKERLEKSGELSIYELIDDYRILMHRDVEKDWFHLKESEVKKANEIISNTPKFPKNIPPKNDPLKSELKGWFSQRVSHKDRVVYKKVHNERTVYIATVCDHYKDAERRIKNTVAYR